MLVFGCSSLQLCYSQPIVNSYLDNTAGDMLLMYYGGKYRKNWTKTQLKNIVSGGSNSSLKLLP